MIPEELLQMTLEQYPMLQGIANLDLATTYIESYPNPTPDDFVLFLRGSSEYTPEEALLECYEETTIRKIKKGDYFRLKKSETAPVWVRGEYERSIKKYSCYKFDDINHDHFYSGDKKVYINFIF